MNDTILTKKQQYIFDQVEATLAIENMKLSIFDRKNLEDIASGRKTADQVLEELDKIYDES